MNKDTLKIGYKLHDQGYHDLSTVLTVQEDGVIVSQDDGLHFYTFEFLNKEGYNYITTEAKISSPFSEENQ